MQDDNDSYDYGMTMKDFSPLKFVYCMQIVNFSSLK